MNMKKGCICFDIVYEIISRADELYDLISKIFVYWLQLYIISKVIPLEEKHIVV